MKGKFFFCFMVTLQLLSCSVSVAKRPFPPIDAMSHPGPEEAPAPAPNKNIELEKVKELYDRDIEISSSKIGSSPPSCDHKCYGCTPCEATQVPSTTSKRIHFGLQYANYEPESWKCKCGPSFYSP